jgi:hypothetical protein
MGNEHDTNELLQRSVYRNKKKTKTQTSREQEDNNKEKTTQIETNNAKNEHDKSNKPILFTSEYSMCDFSTFDTTCVNHHKQYKNKYPHENIKKPQ